MKNSLQSGLERSDKIKAVAVIGAGNAGRSIAQSAAIAGYRTILVDILPASLRRAQSEIHDRLLEAQNIGRLSPEAAAAALQRLEVVSSLSEAAREADLVIEAVPDEMESKLEIFMLLDKISRPHTILASTTSSLNVSEIASVTYRKTKILGLRFRFSGGDQLGTLQIVRTGETDDQTCQLCAAAGTCMNLKCEFVAESPAKPRS